jgi:hypothetical protein
MSITVHMQPEPDGTLKYLLPDQDAIIRVLAQRRNGTKRCPVELFHQATLILSTDANLRSLRDLEDVLRHVGEACKGLPAASLPWHAMLTTVAAALPEEAPVLWTAADHPLGDYAVAQTQYHWYPVLPKGEPVGIQGDPGMGKSALLVKLCCHLTTGKAFPALYPADHPEQDFEPQTVLLFSHEDHPNTTLRPRVEINGGDVSRIRIIEGKRHPVTGAVVPLTLQDLDLLDALLTTHHPALMAFDPLQGFVGNGVDMNSANDTRPLLDAVAALCRRHHCTPLYVRHNGKAQRDKVIHTALGSVDITASLRSVLALYKDPEDTQRRILAHTKSNGRHAPSIAMKLLGATLDVPTDTGTLSVETVIVRWDGRSDLTADDLNARETTYGGDHDEARSALDAARAFLREVLTDGPQLIEEIAAQAKKAGVSEKTVRRAKDKEHLRARRRPQADVAINKWPWEWYDPLRHGEDS